MQYEENNPIAIDTRYVSFNVNTGKLGIHLPPEVPESMHRALLYDFKKEFHRTDIERDTFNKMDKYIIDWFAERNVILKNK